MKRRFSWVLFERKMDGSSSNSQRFRLNESSIPNHDGKLFIFVKLTDSCLKSIETYLKQNKKSNNQKSIIKFNSNGGVSLHSSLLHFLFGFSKDISIPINNGDKRIYSFQISPENKTPEVFESIKQINKEFVSFLLLLHYFRLF